MSDRGLGKFMRGQLASVGIMLDEEKPVVTSAPVVEKSPAYEPDREFIRTALEHAGAPARDLDWLTASCPDELLALEYKPPREAWCVLCDAVRLVDDDGCVGCRIAKARELGKAVR